MIDILIRAFSLVLIVLSGFFIKRIGWVKREDFGIFSNIVLRYTIPCSIITSFNEMTIVTSLLLLTVIGFGINMITASVGIIKGRNNKDRAFNILNYGSFNIGAFTLPYISAFLGAKAVVMASLFDVGNTLASAGINYSFAKSLAEDNKRKVSLWGIIKNMLHSAIFDTYIIMFILRLLDLKLPAMVTTFTGIVAEANTFLAMLMIGIGFEFHIDKNHLKKALSSLAMRYAITIGVAIGIFFFLPVATEVKKVLCIMIFSPIAAMTPGFTAEIKGNVIASSFMASLSILISIIIITSLLMFI